MPDKLLKYKYFFYILFAPFCLAPGIGLADEFASLEGGEDASVPAFDRILVIGSRQQARQIPGSATYIGEDELEAFE